MRALVLLVGLLVVAQVASAQSFALPNSFCSYQSQVPNRVNGFNCFDIPFTYQGTNYYLDFTSDVPEPVTFQDLSTGAYTSMQGTVTEVWQGTSCTQGPAPWYKPCTSYATITVTFSGAYNGTLVFDYTLHAAVSRYWHYWGIQTDGLLTIN
jgi:hypothetical protein